jgi:DUF438 domain-containing protein
MSEYKEFLKEKENKKESIRELLKRLHQGEKPGALKEEFRDAIKGLMPDEIAALEGELIESGVPAEEVHRLCDVHLQIFRENLENSEVIAPPGHPVNILMEEHKLQMDYAGELKELANRLKSRGKEDTILEELMQVLDRIDETESHYVREENVLFPYLEKHGITQPPQIMWTDHDTVRGLRKDLKELVKSRGEKEFAIFAGRLDELAIAVAESLESNIFKENNVLFPTSIKVIEAGEWKEVREQFDDLGYCSYTPEPPEMPTLATSKTVGAEEATEILKQQHMLLQGKGAGAGTGTVAGAAATAADGQSVNSVEFETGKMTFKEIEAVFDTLPVDVTFVGKDDTVRYFSQSPERVFPRAKAIIGRTVQNCHPQKSLHMVNAILDGFREGKKEPADFWIDMGEIKVYIRYFPVHGKDGEYLGCLEVTQNIAPIQKIEGEKRLL